jgi:hypothetical protein
MQEKRGVITDETPAESPPYPNVSDDKQASEHDPRDDHAMKRVADAVADETRER